MFPAPRQMTSVWMAALVACAWVCLSGNNAPAHWLGGVLLLLTALPLAWHCVTEDVPSRGALALWIVAGVAGGMLLRGAWRWAWIGLAASSLLLLLPGGGLEGWPRSAVGPAALRLSSAKSSRSTVAESTQDRQAACPSDHLPPQPGFSARPLAPILFT